MVASHKLPNEFCVIDDFTMLSGGVKINKFGKGELKELAEQDKNQEGFRK
jgi:hypothetical protein